MPAKSLSLSSPFLSPPLSISLSPLYLLPCLSISYNPRCPTPLTHPSLMANFKMLPYSLITVSPVGLLRNTSIQNNVLNTRCPTPSNTPIQTSSSRVSQYYVPGSHGSGVCLVGQVTHKQIALFAVIRVNMT